MTTIEMKGQGGKQNYQRLSQQETLGSRKPESNSIQLLRFLDAHARACIYGG